MTADDAVARTHAWFEQHSGWAPPDEGTMTEWLADGMCRAPDDCQTTPEGVCEHGLASWKRILEDLEPEP